MVLPLAVQLALLQLAKAGALSGKKQIANTAEAKYEIRMMRSPDYMGS